MSHHPSSQLLALPSRGIYRHCISLNSVRWLGFLVVGFALALVGFAASDARTNTSGFPMEITDALGEKIVLRHAPTRVVSLTPSNTETLFALGAGPLVVGVTKFCNYPVEAQVLPKIGGFAARTMSIEAIAALRPDLVITGDENHRSVAEALSRLGIPTLSVKVRNFDDLYAALTQIGRVIGHQEEAERLVGAMRVRVRAVTERAAAIPNSRRVRVYWEVFDEPLMSAGPRSIIGQQIALAGGINVFADVAEDYPHVSAEAVIVRNPQVILGPTLMRAQSLTWERLSKRSGWLGIDAVKNRKITTLPDEPVSRPGPRLVEGLELIAAQLYPEYFPGGDR